MAGAMARAFENHSFLKPGDGDKETKEQKEIQKDEDEYYPIQSSNFNIVTGYNMVISPKLLVGSDYVNMRAMHDAVIGGSKYDEMEKYRKKYGIDSNELG